jgi:LEA14-like dessication related protein
MRLKTVLVLTVVHWIMIHGCAGLDQIIQKPMLSFDSLQLENPSLLESTLNFQFKVDNPNPIGLHTGRVTYDLKLDGRSFTHGRLDRGVSIPAGSAAPMSIPVTIAYLDFWDSFAAMVRNRSAAYDFSGTVAIGPLDIPFRATGNFDLPQLPKFSLDAVQIKKISLAGATLNCRLRVDNPNGFNLLFKKLDYSLALDDAPIAKANAVPQSALGQTGSSAMDLVINLSFADIGRGVYQILMGSSSGYNIAGQVVLDSPTLGDRPIPFSASGQVPFSR